jgi:hypothetical protein
VSSASVADKPDQVANVCAMLQQAHDIFVMAKNDTHTVGYITYRLQERCMQPSTKDAQEPTDKADTFEEYLDFHSMLFNQVGRLHTFDKFKLLFLCRWPPKALKRRTKHLPHSHKPSMSSFRRVNRKSSTYAPSNRKSQP